MPGAFWVRRMFLVSRLGRSYSFAVSSIISTSKGGCKLSRTRHRASLGLIRFTRKGSHQSSGKVFFEGSIDGFAQALEPYFALRWKN